ncbi:cytochrome c biogenesis protein CcsA [Belliella marina]|uniref:Cytochrome c biogenesis protein CcsA n=1 Tax=Belliella marina TaxID=1644146 RepID=A0ABW4VGD8_9BACT
MKFLKILFSTKVSLILLVTFAISMAVATFIENDHGIPVAWRLVYNAWWFETIMIWLAFNFMAHIGQYRLFHRNRWPVGLFHISFVIILLGAGITRYLSVDGVMHIREGSSVDSFYTTTDYLQIKMIQDEGGLKFEKPIDIIPHRFEPEVHRVNFGENRFQIQIKEFIQGGVEKYIDGEETYIDIAVAMGVGREDFILTKGNEINLGNISFGTSKNTNSPIKIFKEDGVWMISTEVHLQIMEMSTQQMAVMHQGDTSPLKLRSLYQWEGGALMIKSIIEDASIVYQQESDEMLAKNMPDIVKLEVADPKGELIFSTYIRKVSFNPSWYPFSYQGVNYTLTYGPKAIKIPFEIYLNAFELERYPGSQSPASYASEVMVISDGEEFPYRIFMNNVLDHKGYRFYQSSYDNDEKGTILSVNQDRPGTYITYLGYALLTIGMMLTLFAKGSRFSLMNKKLGILRKKAASTLVLLLLALPFSIAQEVPMQDPRQSLVPDEYAKDYGKLIVQDLDGRMKPLNTLANEIIRKLSGKTKIEVPTEAGFVHFSPEQFLLAIQLDPVTFSHLPLIKIDRKKSHLAFQALGVEPVDQLSFRVFLDEDGNYLLQELVETSNKLKPSERNESDKEILKTDERFNIFYALLTGDFLRLFPNKLDGNNTWFTSQQWTQGFDEDDALFVKNITNIYLAALDKGIRTGDWEESDETLSYIDLYQQKAGEEVYPRETEIKAELLYNKLRLSARLFGPFWLLGVLMLVLGISKLFKNSPTINRAWTIGMILTWLGFILFTFHLALRWYIAKHPPWSDGFEMMVFVAWGILFFGLVFSNKSQFTIPLSLLFSGTLLFVGFLDWLNPEITNLMPVLHSYWLKIHVAIIVSGYAPLALSAIIALLSLILVIFKPTKPQAKWWLSLQELNIVNEMSITIGLFLLTVGTFLGGVWANESWGRYWAWDPKETWALISVIVYAIVLHLRLIPSLKNSLIYNLASLWAFSSIIMTSFGVNYYLSGLHSYAAGDPVPIPSWVYWAVAMLLIISIIAIWKYQKIEKEQLKKLMI